MNYNNTPPPLLFPFFPQITLKVNGNTVFLSPLSQCNVELLQLHIIMCNCYTCYTLSPLKRISNKFPTEGGKNNNKILCSKWPFVTLSLYVPHHKAQ